MKCYIYNCQRPVTHVLMEWSYFYRDEYVARPYCAAHIDMEYKWKGENDKILTLEEYQLYKIKEAL